jgi:adenylate kinase
MNLILLGIQGSGKGTQAQLLKEYGYKIFETGAQLREISAQDTELGKEVKQIIDGGNLVSDKLVCKLAENFIQENPDSPIIFDGIPRNQSQFETVIQMFQQKAPNFQVLFFELDDETAITRLKKRALLEGRNDDTPEGIKKRIEIFKNHTYPLLDKFKQICPIITVDASRTIEEVNIETQNKLKL